MGKTDLVITWVDGNDPAWLDAYRHAAKDDPQPDYLFRDWGLLRYWFRGVEENIPWVRRIFFITYGHLPEWLNADHEKLQIVRHEEYIPKEYLPTFSSHTIEWNLHRISCLSEQFLLCNDDIFFLKPMQEKDFFQKGVPCDMLHICPVTESRAKTFNHLLLNNMTVLNRHFDMNHCAKTHPERWFSEQYRDTVRLDNESGLRWNRFPGLYYDHMAIPLQKTVIRRIWEEEPLLLDQICRRPFRDFYQDVNIYLARFWSLAEGRFVPCDRPKGKYCLVSAHEEEIAEALNGEYPMACLNEAGFEVDFDTKRRWIRSQMEKRFPERSSFEIG